MIFSFENRELNPDCRDVLNTAAVLETTEFNVFRLAYRKWFGKLTSDTEIERFYVPYMFREVVPPWVRSFCRVILKSEENGQLDAREYVTPKPRLKRQVVVRFVVKLIIAIVSMILLILLADLAAQQMGLAGRCMFPPCY